jgi:hypothetical protein
MDSNALKQKRVRALPCVLADGESAISSSAYVVVPMQVFAREIIDGASLSVGTLEKIL